MESTKPPLYYQNFEWTIFIKLPPIVNNTWIGIEIFNNKAEAESVDNNYLFAVVNTNGAGNITQGVAAITLQSINNNYVLKSVSPHLFWVNVTVEPKKLNE